MEYKKRKEIVGKRFLCVKNINKPKLSRICDWGWRSGVIRAVNRADSAQPSLKCLVEFDDSGWEKREWVSVHKSFQVFLVECGLTWAPPAFDNNSTDKVPALAFDALADRVGYSDSSNPSAAIEDLCTQRLSFVHPSTLKPCKDGDRCPSPSSTEAVRVWLEQQQGQDLLLNAPSVLVGFRLKVYRVDGSTQWYTAVIRSYNETTRCLSLTDDTVLRETSEDPAKVHMQLLGDGVITSILRGENVGVRPSRTRRSHLEAKSSSSSSSVKSSASSSPRSQKHSNSSDDAAETSRSVRRSSKQSSTGTSSPLSSDSEVREEKSSAEPQDDGSHGEVKKQLKTNRHHLLPDSLRAKSAQCHKEKEEDSMHYKKIHLLDFGARKEGDTAPQHSPPHNSSEATTGQPAVKDHSGINLNQSLTDQITKMSRTSEASAAAKRNWEDMAAATSLASMSGAYPSECPGGVGAGPSPRGDGPGPGPSPDRPTSSGHMEHNNNKDSEAAWSQRSATHAEQHAMAAKDNAKGNSPLVPDKSRKVEPYRDPELLKKDQEIRRFQQGSRPSSVHSLTPTVTTSSSHFPVDSSHAYPAATAVTTLAPSTSHPLMAAMPASYAHQLNAAQLQLHQQLAAGSQMSMLQQQQVAAHLQLQLLQQQQQQQQQAAARGQQPTNLLPYAHNPLQTHQLEILWQQKYPNMGVPPPWMLHQYQEEVLRDVSLLAQRSSPAAEMAALQERERRERDAIERERVERAERERVEQERRDREDRERKDREEAVERQRQQQAEQDRLERERERAEAVERERKEQERMQMETQRRLDRERILLESAALTGNVSDAVNKHFQESLRLASQKRSGGTWNPTPSLLPKHPLPPPHSSSAQPQQSVGGGLGSAFTPLGAKRTSSVSSPSPKEKAENPEHQAQAQVLASFKQHHAALEASHYQVHQQLLMKQQQHSDHEAKHRQHDKVKPEPKGYYPAATSASKQEQPNFSLYGYPPYQPMYISRDKLQSMSKEDQLEMDSRATLSPAGHNKAVAAMGMTSPPPLIKDKGSSVIVENKPNEVMFQAHGSITLGTARAQHHTVKAETKAVPLGSPPQAHHRAMRVASPKQLSPDMQPLDLKQKSKDNRAPPAPSRPPAAYNHSSQHSSQPPHAMMQQGYNTLYSSGSLPHHHQSNMASTTSSTAVTSAVSTLTNQHPLMASGREEQPGQKRPVAVISQDAASVARSKKPRPEEPGTDSFRSFVEKTVQSAFFKEQTQQPPREESPATSMPSATTTTATSSTSSSSVLSSLPSSVVMRPGPASTPGGASVGSACSIMDTINRVVNATNGVLDTDSDTMSAPSPPAIMKASSSSTSLDAANPSPLKAQNPTKFKKAWLQRYSDEDKKVMVDTPPPGSPEQEKQASSSQENGDDRSSDSMKDCYVNCSYISPTKDGANKSPISLLKDLARTSEEVGGTTSASEAESHMSTETTGSCSKKVKAKKRRAAQPSAENNMDNKRVKGSDSRPSTPASVSSLKQSKAGSRTASPVPRTQTPTPSTNKKQKPKAIKKEKVVSDSDSDSKSSRPATPPPAPAIVKCKTEKPDSRPASPTAFVSDCEAKMARKWKERAEKGGDRQNPSHILTNKPLNREPLTKYKKSLEPFSQDDSCFEITPKLMKCRECRMTPHQKNKKMANIFCRFYAFRRLRYNPKGYLTIAGFSEPSDADAEDIELWMPCSPVNKPSLDLEMAKYIMANVGDRFCELVEQEKGAMAWVSPDTKIAWKRAVQGVREMCDSCDTTLFNFHWVCHKCGFVVCLDCYRLRMRKISGCTDHKCTTCENQGQRWLTCSANRQPHEPEKLMITQIIPSDVLWVLGRRIHEAREKYGIKANCPCNRARVDQVLKTNGLSHQSKDTKPLTNGVTSGGSSPIESTNALSPLSLLAEAAASRESEAKTGEEDEDKKCSTLRDLLTKKNAKKQQEQQQQRKQPNTTTLDDIIQKVVESKHPGREGASHKSSTLAHYVPRHGTTYMAGRDEPIPCYTLTETSLLFPDVPHTWLDHGRLLRLLEPRNGSNIKLFQQQWRRAQPVLVSNCDKYLNMNKWKPREFSKEYGHLENDLVNCQTNIILLGHKMKVFWDSFERVSSRLKDSKHRPITLKLKDWPPTEDFAELMPDRFQDLMQGLPLPEYTQRQGVFNLASRLPEFFVKPDLGPKMYNAYGSALTPKSGSTNLHLDVSDAVNMMMYVGVPEDEKEIQEKAALEAMEKAGCCDQTLARVKDGEKPGALWHIYDPQDADKIRDLLNKVAKEEGETIESHHDPIHDQSWYLDENLRTRLLKEYEVQGYTIVQFLGDAVFIPCGAPHQVRNLHSCIKVAEDFVSPENMDYCFKMTQEFRHLSDTHSNHEDKLQIKNIIYHAMKDAVAVMLQDV